MNNLYGKAMGEYLPYGGFKWVKVNYETINRVLNGYLILYKAIIVYMDIFWK